MEILLRARLDRLNARNYKGRNNRIIAKCIRKLRNLGAEI